jgi:hypothetical protein
MSWWVTTAALSYRISNVFALPPADFAGFAVSTLTFEVKI